MGALCDCLKKTEDAYAYKTEPSVGERTPLLSHIPPPPPQQIPPISARNKSTESQEELVNVLDDKEPDLTPLDIQEVEITEIDKQFKDHAGLYNEYLSRYQELLECMEVMNADKEDGFRALQQFMTKLRAEMNSEGLKHLKPMRRFQLCMELAYEGHYFNEDINLVLQKFNRANRLIKELVDKKKAMLDSVAMVLKNEDKIKRDIFVHCTDTRLTGKGPELWRISLTNLKSLRRITPGANYISSVANQAFDQLVQGAAILCK